MRCETMVRNGSFAAAGANASFASASVTPSISKMIFPGWISHTKYSGLPLPFPMRTSAGLVEIGLSGNTRIQMRPPRLMWRDIARRAATTWRAVRRPRARAFRPYSPTATLARRVAPHDLALVDPYLDADHAVGRLGLTEAVIDVGAQGMQRDATFAIPLRTRDLDSIQTARAHDLDALRSESHRVLHRTLHRATEH